MRPVQYFSKEYLLRCKEMSPDEIAGFLDDFRKLRERSPRSRLISVKVPEDLLATFRERCRLEGIPYTRQIKRLMRTWLAGGGAEGSVLGEIGTTGES